MEDFLNMLRIMSVGSFGAILSEIIHWYNLRNKLELKKFKNLLKSKSYWVITVISIISSGIGTYIWYHGSFQELRNYMILGLCFPLLVKKIVNSFYNEPTHLGKEDDVNIMKDYFV